MLESRKAMLTGAVLGALGVGQLFLVTSTLLAHPLFPFQMGDIGWTSAWLLTTIGDYYTVTACLCGAIMYSDGFGVGVSWSLAVCLLGSPFACLWTVLRLWTHGNVAILAIDEDFNAYPYAAHQ